MEIIRIAAELEKKVGNEKAYKKYVNMGLEKINKYQMPDKERFEKMLAES